MRERVSPCVCTHLELRMIILMFGDGHVIFSLLILHVYVMDGLGIIQVKKCTLVKHCCIPVVQYLYCCIGLLGMFRVVRSAHLMFC